MAKSAQSFGRGQRDGQTRRRADAFGLQRVGLRREERLATNPSQGGQPWLVRRGASVAVQVAFGPTHHRVALRVDHEGAAVEDGADGEVSQSLVARHDRAVAGIGIGVMDHAGNDRVRAEHAPAVHEYLELVLAVEVCRQHRAWRLLDEIDERRWQSLRRFGLQPLGLVVAEEAGKIDQAPRLCGLLASGGKNHRRGRMRRFMRRECLRLFGRGAGIARDLAPFTNVRRDHFLEPFQA